MTIKSKKKNGFFKNIIWYAKSFMKSKYFLKTKNFFYKKSEKSLLRYNIIFVLLVITTLYLCDIVGSISGSIPISFSHFGFANQVLMFIPLFLCLSFSNIVFQILISSYLSIIVGINIFCRIYAGCGVNYDILATMFNALTDLFKFKDELNDYSTVFWLSFIVIPFVFLIFFTIKYRKRFIRSTFATCLLIIIYIPIRSNLLVGGMHYPNEFAYSKYTSLFHGSKTFQIFIENFFLYEKTHIDFTRYKEFQPIEVKLRSKNSPRVIVLFWGESTNAHDLSIINKKQRETTPKLEKFEKQNPGHLFYNSAVSGASTTNPSTDLFFSLQNTPGYLMDNILQKNTNLFELAKKNGYKTYWISRQSTVPKRKARINADYEVTYEVISKNGHETKKDGYLLEELKKIDTSHGKHFIVIHPMALHVPYETFYKDNKDFYKFAVKKNIDKYHNAVRYVDYIVSEVIKISKKKGADYVIMTSDHGETIDDGVGYGRLSSFAGGGRGHLVPRESSINVPFIVYSKSGLTPKINYLKNKRLLKHADISKFVANLIGYDVIDKADKKDIAFLYPILVGDYSMLRVELVNGERKITYKGFVSDYIKKYWNKK